ncbi:MAG TPA: flagellar hook-associated protein FlgL [Candidatus Acidoferrales bacterium]|jgi:flagellar hook-associated protein 3 FlgL|nr:flagellar hook-associated protein FlgL [Candidatus Acidoferrales bacterium]
MRIATNAYTDSMLNQFNLLASTQQNLQSQVSTGLRVQAPSDDPVAMQNTLGYLANQSVQAQYSANIGLLQTRAASVDTVLQSLQTISSRAGEIATGAGSATNSQSDLNNYADEVNKLINQVVSAANTKDPSTGKYLFGGTASGSAPFTTATDANGDVTGVTYNGNSTVNQAQIGAGLTASADIPGANTSGTGARGLITDSQSGADFLNHLISLRDNLQAGNTTAVTNTDAANLQKDENNISYQVANNGVMQNQLTAAGTFATSSSQSLSQMISNSSSADLMTTMVQLNQAQTSYQAALQSGAKIMQLSLLNYIQ